MFYTFFLPLFCYNFLFVYRGGSRSRWYKFNDNVVEEFDMNDETLEYECFGGEYRPKVYDQCTWAFLQIRLSRQTKYKKSPNQMLVNVNYIVSKSFVEEIVLFSCS